ncbi:hypothetical protein CKJ90_15080, partial [Klebsiella pneumoniae]
AAGSDEQAAPILRQLAAHGVTLIALPMTNLLLQMRRRAHAAHPFPGISAAATAARWPLAATNRRRRSCASWRRTASPLSLCR